MSNYDEIEKLLRDKEKIIQVRLDKIISEKKRADGPLSPKFDEQQVELENKDVIDALDTLEREELIKIREALEKIEKGTFGQCIECGDEIEVKRLKALPYALKCMSCESA
jgi:DnaK suppressor protein